jgi:hypothetical protein
MNLINLNFNKANNLAVFITSWSKLYSLSNEAIYSKSIVKESFTKTDIQNLYIWKNGMRLSKLKQKSLDTKIKEKLSIINAFKTNDEINIESFRKEFKNLSAAVWKIFLLHIIKPNKYPIYDQHIHRTFLFIHNEDWSNIKNTMSNKAKEQFYFERYVPFIESKNIKDLKKLDEAFFAFGQFLNTRNYATLLQ